jgi:hypothetical protein
MSIEHSPARAAPRYMTRRQLAAFLQEQGYPVTENTLHKLGAPSRGEGPEPIARWGKIILYSPAKGLEWAETQLRPATTGVTA